MSILDLFFLAVAIAPFALIGVVFALAHFRNRRARLATHGVPLTQVGRARRYKLPRGGGVILEALALCLCSWAILAALWLITTGVFAL